MKKNIWSLFSFCEKKDDKRWNHKSILLLKVKKSQLIWQIHISFQRRFGCVSSVHFQALIMIQLRYKYYSKWITILNNSNVQSHDQEESKSSSTMNANSGAHTLPHDKIIKSPFNKNNVAVIKNK